MYIVVLTLPLYDHSYSKAVAVFHTCIITDFAQQASSPVAIIIIYVGFYCTLTAGIWGCPDLCHELNSRIFPRFWSSQPLFSLVNLPIDHHLSFYQLNLHIRNHNVRPQRRYVQTPAQSIISFLLRLFASQPPFPRTTLPRLPPCRVLIVRAFVVFDSLNGPQQSYQHNQDIF